MSDESTSSGAAAARVDFVALKPGQTIARYEIQAVLGQGGFGITYRARDTQLGREVALKEYLPTSLAVRQGGSSVLPRSTDVAEDFNWGRDRFVAEGRTLASLHDAPAIVRVFDFLEANGTAYIVMELVRGETLENRLKRGTLGPAELDAILWPLLDGLEQVHGAGFLHRDIKPANILLNASGKPTLIDFGASRAAIASRTTALTAIFTPGYAAPEQFTSARQGPWTDIYGLAATLYRALSGVTPPSSFDRMLDDLYQPLASLAPRNYAPRLLAGIDAGLAVRAAERPQSIAEWRAQLAGTAPAPARAGQTTTMVVPPAAPPARPPSPAPAAAAAVAAVAAPAPAPTRSRRRLYAAGAALAVLMLAGAGGWFVLVPKLFPSTATASVGLQDMRTEDLERVLAERRKAEAAAAEEKRRQEEEARKKAEAEEAAKQAAAAALQRAQSEREKAEAELNRLKAEMDAQKKAAAEQQQAAEAKARQEAMAEAQRKAEADMAALKQAEQEAERKAAANAEAKRQADEALAKAQAERQKADADAKARAEADAKVLAEAQARTKADADAKARADADAKSKVDTDAKAQADAKTKADADKAAADAAQADRKAAETAETALRLAPLDRQHLQVALTALGFDTRGSDGVFGPRSRDMIAAWQKARNQPSTGFLTGAQNQALLKEAAPAIAKYDDEQKKLEEDKKKADEAAKAQTAASPVAAAGAFDGNYAGSVSVSGSAGVGPMNRIVALTVQISGARLSGQGMTQSCGNFPFALTVSATGEIGGSTQLPSVMQCGLGPVTGSGRVSGNSLQIVFHGPGLSAQGVLTKGAAAPTVAAVPAPPPASGAFDGSFAGAVTISLRGGGTGQINALIAKVASISVQVSGTRMSGQGTTACGTFPINVAVSASGAISGSIQFPDALQCAAPTAATVNGQVKGDDLDIAIRSVAGFNVVGTLKRGAAAPAIYGGGAPVAAPASPASAASPFDGKYTGGGTASFVGGNIANAGYRTVNLSMQITGGTLVGQGTTSSCGGFVIGLPVASAGDIVGDLLWPDPQQCPSVKASFRGKVSGGALQFEVSGPGFKVQGQLNKAN